MLKFVGSTMPINDLCLLCGVFDPLTESSLLLISEVIEHSLKRGLTPSLLLFDPKPDVFLSPQIAFEYHDCAARLRILRLKFGDKLQIIVKMTDPAFFRSGTFEFLNDLCSRVKVSELIIGHRQSFGNGEHGNQESIRREASRHGFGLRILPPNRGVSTRRIRELIINHRLESAINEVGFPPLFSRSNVRLSTAIGWPVSTYLLSPWVQALDGSHGAIKMPVSFFRDNEQTRFYWPSNDVETLTCVADLFENQSEIRIS